MSPDRDKRNISDFTKEAEWWCMQTRMLLSRVPVASLVAFLMCVGGIVVFSVCLYEALEYLIKRFDIAIISKIVWLIMLVHIVLATMFLIVAMLSTGRTRKDVCTHCVAFNVIGRCTQCVMISIAYLLHLIWLILPAVLLLPVALLTAFVILCKVLPDCITLSDYGLPPDIMDKVKPDDILNTIRNINSSDLEQYIAQAEAVIEGAIEHAENSPILEDILSKIENNIPDDEEIERFIAKVVDNMNVDQVVATIDTIQGHVDKGAEKIQEVINKTSDHVDKLDIGETVAGYVDEANQSLSVGRDHMESELDGITHPNKSLNRGLLLIESGQNQTDTEMLQRRHKRQVADSTVNTDKLKQDVDAMKDSVDVAADEIKQSADSLAEDTKRKVHENVDELKNETSRQVEELKDKAQVIVSDTKAGLENQRDHLEREAEHLRESVQETADTVRQSAEDTAEGIQDEAEKVAADIRKKGEETARDLEEKGEMVIQDVKAGIVKQQENVQEGIEEAKEFGRTKLEEGKQQLGVIKDKAREYGDNAKEWSEDTVEDIVQTAHQVAEEAKLVANIAARAAEKALQNAMDAAKTAALEVDKKAKELARQIESKARDAAAKAQSAATKALQKAKEAIQNADDLAKAVSQGAVDMIRKTARNVRHYALEAIRVAKIAAKEAAKGARQAAKMYDVVKTEVLKGYDIFMMVTDQLGIERKGQDTICSEAKVMYCKEIVKSQLHIMVVFAASFILNLSMVHFLMAMTANYVHIKRELKISRIRKEMDKSENEISQDSYIVTTGQHGLIPNDDKTMKSPLLEQKEEDVQMSILSYNMTDTGSFVTAW